MFNKSGTEILHYPQAKAGIYTIPDSVTNVKANAFDNCTGLTDLIIKKDVRSRSTARPRSPTTSGPTSPTSRPR
jgi:hypothetical protein